MIPPGHMLGCLGGGQLGRMFALAARTLGYDVTILDPDPQSPAAAVADVHLCAPYDDAGALAELAQRSAAITVEFENVPAQSMRFLAERRPVRPHPEAVAIAQDRVREKEFFRAHGLPVAPFAIVRSADDVAAALAVTGTRAVLKRAQLGYDGKGQAIVAGHDEAVSAFRAFGETLCVLEPRLDLTAEISVVLAIDADGRQACYPVAENIHRNGILDISIVPARVAPSFVRQALDAAGIIAQRLCYCGVLAVEFFVVGEQLLLNEIAPRPHNSGHYTLDACVISQFEQQVRTLCGLPLGGVELTAQAVMVNLLGDLWANGEPDWRVLLAEPGAKLHLYGKRSPRPGRKMGHYTCVSNAGLDHVLRRAQALREQLAPRA